jgi:hypothetical protein
MHSVHFFCGSSNCNIGNKKKWHDLPNLEDIIHAYENRAGKNNP